MKNLLIPLRNLAFGFCLMLGSVQVVLASDNTDDGKIQAEVTKFCEDNDKLRIDHIQAMRELHLKHINEIYDLKLENNKEINDLWKALKPGDKDSKAAILEQVKIKRKAFNKLEDKLREEFRENVLKKKNKEFRESMHDRVKNLKNKHKE